MFLSCERWYCKICNGTNPGQQIAIPRWDNTRSRTKSQGRDFIHGGSPDKGPAPAPGKPQTFLDYFTSFDVFPEVRLIQVNLTFSVLFVISLQAVGFQMQTMIPQNLQRNGYRIPDSRNFDDDGTTTPNSKWFPHLTHQQNGNHGGMTVRGLSICSFLREVGVRCGQWFNVV